MTEDDDIDGLAAESLAALPIDAATTPPLALGAAVQVGAGGGRSTGSNP